MTPEKAYKRVYTAWAIYNGDTRLKRSGVVEFHQLTDEDVKLAAKHAKGHPGKESIVKQVREARRHHETTSHEHLHRLVEAREEDMARDHMTHFQKLAGIRPTLPSLEEKEGIETEDEKQQEAATQAYSIKGLKPSDMNNSTTVMGALYKSLPTWLKRRQEAGQVTLTHGDEVKIGDYKITGQWHRSGSITTYLYKGRKVIQFAKETSPEAAYREFQNYLNYAIHHYEPTKVPSLRVAKKASFLAKGHGVMRKTGTGYERMRVVEDENALDESDYDLYQGQKPFKIQVQPPGGKSFVDMSMPGTQGRMGAADRTLAGAKKMIATFQKMDRKHGEPLKYRILKGGKPVYTSEGVEPEGDDLDEAARFEVTLKKMLPNYKQMAKKIPGILQKGGKTSQTVNTALFGNEGAGQIYKTEALLAWMRQMGVLGHMSGIWYVKSKQEGMDESAYYTAKTEPDREFAAGWVAAMKRISDLPVEDVERGVKKAVSGRSADYKVGYQTAVAHWNGTATKHLNRAHDLGLVKAYSGYHGQGHFRHPTNSVKSVSESCERSDGPVLLGRTVLAESVGQFRTMSGIDPLPRRRLAEASSFVSGVPTRKEDPFDKVKTYKIKGKAGVEGTQRGYVVYADTDKGKVDIAYFPDKGGKEVDAAYNAASAAANSINKYGKYSRTGDPRKRVQSVRVKGNTLTVHYR